MYVALIGVRYKKSSGLNMQPLTPVVIRSKYLDCPCSLKLRQPEPEDWQRWQPRLMARYKVSPARLFIEEMKAEGLKTT